MADGFLEELANADSLDLLLTHALFSRVPYVFGEDRHAWSAWKSQLAKGLDVDPHSVMIVGSGAVGVSLNPNKQAFKSFDNSSDIDVAVVSTRHFEVAWHSLRSLGARIFRFPKATQNEIKEFAPDYVYWGVIATDRLLGVLPFGPAWMQAIEPMRQRDPTKDRDIKIRLYRDIESLRAYQFRGLRTARQRLGEEAKP